MKIFFTAIGAFLCLFEAGYAVDDVFVTLERQAVTAGYAMQSLTAADKAFIANNYEQAVALYEEAVADSKDMETTLLPRYIGERCLGERCLT